MLQTITSMIITVLPILGILTHILTVIVAGQDSGFFVTFLTLVFPPISEVYWFFKIGSSAGFLSFYCLIVWSLLVLLGLAFVGMMTSKNFDHLLKKDGE